MELADVDMCNRYIREKVDLEHIAHWFGLLEYFRQSSETNAINSKVHVMSSDRKDCFLLEITKRNSRCDRQQPSKSSCLWHPALMCSA